MNLPLTAALAAALALASLASAKVPPLLAVPSNVEPSARAELTAQHDALAQRLAELRKWSADYNANCGNRDLPANDPRVADCLAQKSKLDAAGQTYTRDLEAYNDAVLRRSAIGSVGETRGEIRIVRPDNQVVSGTSAGAPAILNYGTRIETGANGYFRGTLRDGATFTLGANSQVTIEPLPASPAAHDGLTLMAAKGLLHWIGAAARGAGLGERLKVRIPTAVIAVRGTEFEVELAPDGSGTVKLLSGAVSVTPQHGAAFDLGVGQMATVAADGTWSAPRSLAAERPSV